MNLSNNPKRALIITMSALFIIGFGIARSYFKYQNKYVDSRVVPARELYKKYDVYAQDNNFSGILSLLDSIEYVYSNIEHYRESYEMGVLYNNRAATYLTMALHFADSSLSLDGINLLSKDSLILLGEQNVIKSILFYKNWLIEFEQLNEEQIKNAIRDDYFKRLNVKSEKDKENYLKIRIKEITTAQYETKRRLSVAYTNFGIVQRHKKNYKEAIEYYNLAIELWERNLSAENNLNILLGRPQKKQKAIHKFFPPDKNDYASVPKRNE